MIGPTAIGKTNKSIALAQAFNTEIISADSRQFYKEMKIGTAVPSAEELARVPHHFVQHIFVDDNYDVGNFEKDALLKLEELFKKHQVVFLVGGSGLFVKAVCEGLNKFPDLKPEIRKKLNTAFKEKGLQFLQEELKRADPEYYEEVDINNHRRIIRALEIYRSSGKPYSYFLHQEKEPRPFQTIKIGLKAPREVLYQRIEKRVDIMMTDGLLKEAEKLYPQRHKNALNTIGYKELYNYIEKKYDLDSAVNEIKKNTRRFAKRQLTWFRRDPEINWFEYDCEADEIENFIRTQINM